MIFIIQIFLFKYLTPKAFSPCLDLTVSCICLMITAVIKILKTAFLGTHISATKTCTYKFTSNEAECQTAATATLCKPSIFNVTSLLNQTWSAIVSRGYFSGKHTYEACDVFNQL